MSSVEEFGQYLLLKKLSEDPLGEAFRAGRVGGAGMEQVVLLRIFNGRTINGPHLWQAVGGRGEVQRALRSPNIGEGVDLGEVRGIPYVAYEYISGKSLASLLVQASTENTPIPLDHALLIAERLALALSMAHEARVDGERLLHGFVVPHLAMVSNEGETRLLGFEVAPGLRDLAAGGAFGPEIGRYLAPELIAEGGVKVDRADDVWSLGVILYELLTCRPLPRPGADGGYGALLDAAELPQEGGPIPPDAVALLKRSLAPRPQRIADAVNWHKAISKVLIDGGHAATTFNLAFFMHNLFRAEIERESQEIEAEKTIEIPRQAIAAGLAAAAPPVVPTARPAEAPALPRPTAEDTGSRQRGYGVDRSDTGRGGGGLWIGLAAAVLVALVVGAYFFYFQNRAVEPPPPDPAATAPVEVPAEPTPPLVDAPPAEPEPAGPTPEEIQAQLTRMIEARSAEMEAKLRSQYDDRIKGLQDQLQATQEASARREAEMREQQRLAAERRAAEARAAEQAAAQQPETEEVADRGPGTAAAGAAQPAGAAPATGQQAAAGAPPAGLPPATGADSSSARSQAASQAPSSAPAESRVRVGDLVGFGPGVTPPDLIRMPDPIFPALAKRLNKSAIVEVRVLVDEKGEVQQAEVAGKKAGFGFDQAAVDAARRATYKPATKDGVRVKMWTQLKVKFEP